MSNLIGEPFSPFVKSQVDLRQTSLGQYSNIDADSMKYYSSKTPFLRLASSVNVNDLLSDGETIMDTIYQRLIAKGYSPKDVYGDNLAKNLILFSGVTKAIDTKTQKETGEDGKETSFITSKYQGNNRRQINYNSADKPLQGSYGWGGIDERGYVPMPGITSAQTTYYNNGALSKATVKLKCWSKAQFTLIDVLYLRPGYTLLLEFGWSQYLTNLGVIPFPSFTTYPLDFLLNPDSVGEGVTVDQNTMYRKIQNERELHGGNYEGVYGKVTNFQWNFNSDGSYDISIDLVGMGDILQSLKLNVVDPFNNNQSNTNPDIVPSSTFREYGEGFWGDNLWKRINDKNFQNSNIKFPTMEFPKDLNAEIKNKSKNKFNRSSKKEDIIAWTQTKYDAQNKLAQDKSDWQADNEKNDAILSNKQKTKLNKEFYSAYQLFKNSNNKFSTIKKSYYGVPHGLMQINHTFRGDMNFGGETGKRYKSVYMKFSSLLSIIEKTCNLFLPNGRKLMNFDFAFGNENDDNYMLIMPPNLSANPNVCVVPWTKASIPELNLDYSKVYDKKFVKAFEGAIDEDNKNLYYNNDLPTNNQMNKVLLKTNFLVDNNKYIGRLGSVMLNISFLAESLANAPKDDDGSVSVLDYLQTILNGINTSLGSINNFMVTYDDSTGYVKIYDESPKPGLDEEANDSEFTKFNIFGMKRGEETENNSFFLNQSNVTGSFITNIGLNAEIPSNFATMISIGAQYTGNNLQGNALSFSNYNRGLKDRILPEKNDYVQNNEKKVDRITQAKNIYQQKLYYSKEAYGNNDKISPFSAMYYFEGDVAGSDAKAYDFTEGTISLFEENYTAYIKLVQGIAAEKNTVPSPFFLPFNLNLEMDGISGIKLFQKFRITDDVLPPSYEKDSVDIIVKGINHNVDVNSWTTTLDTLSVPRTKLSEKPIADGQEEVKNDKQKKLEKVVDEDRGPRFPVTTLVLSPQGKQDIKDSEAFRANEYYDTAGVLTIGYGTTKAGLRNAQQWEDVLASQPITKAYADELLMQYVEENSYAPMYSKIKVDLNQNEFDAIVSFIYNIGGPNFRSSTFLKELNKGKYDDAAEAIKLFNKETIDGVKVVSQGLVNRRAKEYDLFLS